MLLNEDKPNELNQNNADILTESVFDQAIAEPKTIIQENISLESYDLTEQPANQFKLPGRLEEISGLAMTTDNRLLAHNDEKAVIHEIDYHKEHIVSAFQLSDLEDPIADDFEGIATANDKVYLVTSIGRIYECNEGEEDESILFNIYTTGVGRDYEIEGLAYDKNKRVLLLMCKNPRQKDLKDILRIYHWSIDTKELIPDAHLVIPIDDFARHIKGKEFQPSGIEQHPISSNYYVIAARQRAIAEITPNGQVVSTKEFPTNWHRQPEGITFTADGRLIIADEGAGKKARLTLYPLTN